MWRAVAASRLELAATSELPDELRRRRHVRSISSTEERRLDAALCHAEPMRGELRAPFVDDRADDLELASRQ